MKSVNILQRKCNSCPFKANCPDECKRGYFCPKKSKAQKEKPTDYLHSVDKRHLLSIIDTVEQYS